MHRPFVIYDPTKSDTSSSVRGVGRYVSLLRDYISGAKFVSSIQNVPEDAVFLVPFYNFLSRPLSIRKIARVQLAVIHDLIPQKYPRHFPAGIRGQLMSFTNRLLLNNFDGIITDSEASKSDIKNFLGFPEDKIRVVYPVISQSLFHALKSAPDTSGEVQDTFPRKPFFLYVGDATWNKNLVHIARAAKIADVPVVFAGSLFSRPRLHALARSRRHHPWLAELAAFSEEIDDDPRFILEGFVSDDRLALLYKSAWACLAVSRDEGFGFPYLEAAHAGCPSVLGDIPVSREVAGDSALFADPEDPVDIADQIKHILLPETRKRLATAARRSIRRFTPTSFKKDFSQIASEFGKVQ
ncbi:MAG: glycosyltransferase family 4 protein [Patescibacteria group bacterium]|nr:glycosyltransferase family 4 protein [Patescibacteria group bacterium]